MLYIFYINVYILYNYSSCLLNGVVECNEHGVHKVWF